MDVGTVTVGPGPAASAMRQQRSLLGCKGDASRPRCPLLNDTPIDYFSGVLVEPNDELREILLGLPKADLLGDRVNRPDIAFGFDEQRRALRDFLLPDQRSKDRRRYLRRHRGVGQIVYILGVARSSNNTRHGAGQAQQRSNRRFGSHLTVSMLFHGVTIGVGVHGPAQVFAPDQEEVFLAHGTPLRSVLRRRTAIRLMTAGKTHTTPTLSCEGRAVAGHRRSVSQGAPAIRTQAAGHHSA
jgi:hypothetical protein